MKQALCYFAVATLLACCLASCGSNAKHTTVAPAFGNSVHPVCAAYE